MEREIIILLVIMVLAIIITALMLRVECKRDQESIYVHIKTGNKYRILQECLMKYDGK